MKSGCENMSGRGRGRAGLRRGVVAKHDEEQPAPKRRCRNKSPEELPATSFSPIPNEGLNLPSTSKEGFFDVEGKFKSSTSKEGSLDVEGESKSSTPKEPSLDGEDGGWEELADIQFDIADSPDTAEADTVPNSPSSLDSMVDRLSTTENWAVVCRTPKKRGYFDTYFTDSDN